MIAESKIDESSPKEQFCFERYEDPYLLDKNCHWDGLSKYVKSDVPTKELKTFQFERGIEYVGFEIKLCKRNWPSFQSIVHPLKHQKYILTKWGKSLRQLQRKI